LGEEPYFMIPVGIQGPLLKEQSRGDLVQAMEKQIEDLQ